MNQLERTEAFLKERGIDFSIRKKSESWLMKLIGTILFFNPKFMTEYTTTIGSTVFFPDNYLDDPDETARTLAHEAKHIMQAKEHGTIRFSLQYLFPLPLALGAIGALFAIWWLPALWCLGFLVFLAPLPAPWRVKYEREAYLVSTVCDVAKGWNVSDTWYQDYMVSHYCGWGYYKPSWNVSGQHAKAKADAELAKQLFSGAAHDNYISDLTNKVLK